MDYAVCYDHSGVVLAGSIFLDITAVLLIVASLAAARLISTSRADTIGRLQIA